MKRFIKILYILLIGAISLVIITIGIFYVKYTFFDRTVQKLYASKISIRKLLAPNIPDKLIELPTSKGNAADNYMRAKVLLEQNDAFLNSIREIRFLLDDPDEFPNDFKIDQAILSELVKATSIKECSFVPKYFSIPDNPDDPWPSPPSYLLSISRILIASGNMAFKEANYDLAEEMYGKVIIMGSHLANHSITPMFVTLGNLMQRQGCRHLLDIYWKQCNPIKGKIVEIYLQQINDFDRVLFDKALAIEGIQYRSGNVPYYVPNHIEIVKKVLLKDEDPMFRIKAALELRKLKLSRYFYFESNVAKKALIDATKDPHPQVQNAVLYAQKYDHEDFKRENEMMFDASKELVKSLLEDPKSKWVVDSMNERENPYEKEALEKVIKEAKRDLYQERTTQNNITKESTRRIKRSE